MIACEQTDFLASRKDKILQDNKTKIKRREKKGLPEYKLLYESNI